MTSKELVKVCEKADICIYCPYEKVCIAYFLQFKCFPFDVKRGYKVHPEANSDTEIQFP